MITLLIILFSIIILYQFQKSICDTKETNNNYLKIFNTVKIPLLFLAVFLILYNDTISISVPVETIVNQKIYTSNFKF